MDKNTIQCSQLGEFLDIIAGLVSRGIVFEADARKLIVTCTGGH